MLLVFSILVTAHPVLVATMCDGATQPSQCAQFTSATLPPYVQDAIASKGGMRWRHRPRAAWAPR